MTSKEFRGSLMSKGLYQGAGTDLRPIHKSNDLGLCEMAEKAFARSWARSEVRTRALTHSTIIGPKEFDASVLSRLPHRVNHYG